MKRVLKPIFKPYAAMADMLAETLGEDCEVVLHDLSQPQHSVVYVANNRVTGRKVGEAFEHLVKQVLLSVQLKDDYVANYYFKAGGKLVRSSTLLIRSEDGALQGALCVNLDTTRVRRQIAYLQTLLPQSSVPHRSAAAETPSDEIAQMVASLIDGIVGDAPVHLLERKERIEKIRFMEQKGIFNVKGSVEQVAAKLGVNKVTVYSYLDEVKGKRG